MGRAARVRKGRAGHEGRAGAFAAQGGLQVRRQCGQVGQEARAAGLPGCVWGRAEGDSGGGGEGEGRVV